MCERKKKSKKTKSKTFVSQNKKIKNEKWKKMDCQKYTDTEKYREVEGSMKTEKLAVNCCDLLIIIKIRNKW